MMFQRLFPVLCAAAFLSTSAGAQLPAPQTREFYVSDFMNDRIVVYGPDGSLSHTFTAASMNGPRGIVFLPDGKFLVASQVDDSILVFRRDETYLTKFGHAQLSGPTGMALSPSGELFVSSFDNARICVFDLKGGFQRSITTPMGTMPGFANPNCVMFDSAGNFYSSSASQNLVYKWDASETFQFSFGPPMPVVLSSPMGIARDVDDRLYVSGGLSDNILAFDTSGTYLGQLTHPDLSGPQGVAFDERGHLFSPSYFLDRIVEFDPTGAYVQTITAGNLDIPRSVAFRPGLPRPRKTGGANPSDAGVREAP